MWSFKLQHRPAYFLKLLAESKILSLDHPHQNQPLIINLYLSSADSTNNENIELKALSTSTATGDEEMLEIGLCSSSAPHGLHQAELDSQAEQKVRRALNVSASSHLQVRCMQPGNRKLKKIVAIFWSPRDWLYTRAFRRACWVYSESEEEPSALLTAPSFVYHYG